jgi:hypothetical protein
MGRNDGALFNIVVTSDVELNGVVSGTQFANGA